MLSPWPPLLAYGQHSRPAVRSDACHVDPGVPKQFGDMRNPYSVSRAVVA